MTSEKALNIIAGICSKKEYCSQEIRDKLLKWEIPEKDTVRILDFLHQNKFVDDNRFAIAYARDKFRFNKWGRQKINQMLWQKGVASPIISEALSTLGAEDYDKTCMALLHGKLKTLKEDSPIKTKAKLIRFAASRGFDFATINRCLSSLTPDFSSEWDE